MNNLATIGFNALKLFLSLLDYRLLNFERRHQFFVNNQLMLLVYFSCVIPTFSLPFISNRYFV